MIIVQTYLIEYFDFTLIDETFLISYKSDALEANFESVYNVVLDMCALSLSRTLKIIIILVFIVIGCTEQGDEQLADCDQLSGGKIISIDQVAAACFYFEVFQYNDEIYSVCHCCTCLKAYVIVDCSGQQLCLNDPNRILCREEFRESAEFLYYVTIQD